MQKTILFAIIFLIFFTSLPSYTGSQNDGANIEESEFQVIPDEAIRLRILANSDGMQDQQLKRTIRDQVNQEITKWVEELASIEDARQLIRERLDIIEEIVAQTLEQYGSEQSYEVDYGKNIEFPTKVYGDFIYPAGEYEAILVTLGEGKGANWWCVLFPPLCFLDFSNGTSVAEEDHQQTEQQDEEDNEQDEEQVDVKFFVLDWFSNWFS
nr:stage II sporulation protein R [Aquibacillus sediminis]